MRRIYLSPPDVGPAERARLLEAFDSNWVAPVGPDIDAFETELASFVGVRAAAALSSGTAGLHLALLLAGVGPGDEVLVPSLTFVATANAVRYVGAEPVFVDSTPGDWCIDPELVADELEVGAREGRPIKAVLSVDLYGQCADHGALGPVCEQYGVRLLEDAAEALGASRGGVAAGAAGFVGVFSFNGNKILTTGGGGMLVSDDVELVDRARFLATQAREPAPFYEHEVQGYNYRLPNLLAAVGRAQLTRLPAMIEQRAAVEARYRAALADRPGVSFLPHPADGRANHWLTVVLLDPEQTAHSPETLRRALEAHDIESRQAWKPMHLQPLFAASRVRGGAVASTVFERGLALPSGSGLSAADQDRVIDTLLDALDRHP